MKVSPQISYEVIEVIEVCKCASMSITKVIVFLHFV